MNTEVGTYRERLDLTNMNKTGFKLDARSSILGTTRNFCERFLKHMNLPKMHSTLPKMHSNFHPKQCPWYSIRLYHVRYISCRTFIRNRRLKACPGLICKGCQEGDQKLDKEETLRVLSVHSWIKTSQGLCYKILC